MSTQTLNAGWIGTVRGKPAVGAKAQRQRTTTSDDIVAFTAITGDRNPLHYDSELAARTPFGRLIVQGGVTSGLLNALVAEDLLDQEQCFSRCSGSSSRPLALAKRSSLAPRSSASATTSRSVRFQPSSRTPQATSA